MEENWVVDRLWEYIKEKWEKTIDLGVYVSSPWRLEWNKKDIEVEVVDSATWEEKDKDFKPYVKDKLATRLNLTEKQKEWVQEYLANGGNASEASRVVSPESSKPGQVWFQMKNNPKIMKYLEETADRCLGIQMSMIENEKTPAAVRMDGIKDRLNRAGINPDKGDSWGDMFIGTINITIDR